MVPSGRKISVFQTLSLILTPSISRHFKNFQSVVYFDAASFYDNVSELSQCSTVVCNTVVRAAIKFIGQTGSTTVHCVGLKQTIKQEVKYKYWKQ